MNMIVILLIGYLIGCISPAALLAKIKNVDLKQEGTKNLGATNTALVLYSFLIKTFKNPCSAGNAGNSLIC